jgi:hypothetical protein
MMALSGGCEGKAMADPKSCAAVWLGIVSKNYHQMAELFHIFGNAGNALDGYVGRWLNGSSGLVMQAAWQVPRLRLAKARTFARDDEFVRVLKKARVARDDEFVWARKKT